MGQKPKSKLVGIKFLKSTPIASDYELKKLAKKLNKELEKIDQRKQVNYEQLQEVVRLPPGI